MSIQNTYTLSKNYEASHTRTIQRVTVVGLIVNCLLSIVKFIAGIVGHSQALVADAVHSLSDSSTDLAVLIGAPYWLAPADSGHPHGHRRIETIITFLIGFALVGIGLGIAWHAVVTLPKYHPTTPGWIAFAVACISMICKEALYRWNVIVGGRIRSSALVANAWHHRSDALSSLPVAIAVLGTRLKPEWTYLDHVAALIVAILVLQASWKILWPALRQLADAGATRDEIERMREIVTDTHGVKALHRLRTRTIGPGFQVDLHVLVDPDLSVREGHNIAGAVKHNLLEHGPHVIDVLVHVEPYEE